MQLPLAVGWGATLVAAVVQRGRLMRTEQFVARTFACFCFFLATNGVIEPF